MNELGGIGFCIAVVGVVAGIAGQANYSIFLNDMRGRLCFRYANLLMAVWAVGFSIGLWVDGIAGAALAVQSSFYFITNEYGIHKKVNGTCQNK